MNRALVIFYTLALAIHATILFWLQPPAPKPPKIFNETYVDVTLTQPPPPEPVVVPPPPPTEPKPEMMIPETKPEPPKPLPPPPLKPVVVPPPLQPKPPPTNYVSVSQPTFAMQAQHIYPPEAARRHQQGVVTLMLYINGSGTLDKIEIFKSSGFPLLDEAAIKEMKQSHFQPAMDGAIPIRSRAQASVTYQLQ